LEKPDDPNQSAKEKQAAGYELKPGSGSLSVGEPG
jgi:hypothetical protein